MTTFTILSRSDKGDSITESGLSARDAAQKLLSDRGREFDIRPAKDGAGFDLWRRMPNEGRGEWEKTFFVSALADRAAAEEDIFTKIAVSWNDDNFVGAHCLTDEQYAETMKEYAEILGVGDTLHPQSAPERGAEFDIERRDIGLSIKETADLCGVSERTVNRWIRNEKSIPDYAWDRLEKVNFGIIFAVNDSVREFQNRDPESGVVVLGHYRTEKELQADRPNLGIPLGAYATMVSRLFMELISLGFNVDVKYAK